MKKILASLAVMGAMLGAVAPADAAVVMGANGLWYGNICRTGAYWSVVPYQLVGATCWNYAIGGYGVVTSE